MYATPLAWTPQIPDEPGYYLCYFKESDDLKAIRIVKVKNELRNLNGASTHFSRWVGCIWTKIEPPK